MNYNDLYQREYEAIDSFVKKVCTIFFALFCLIYLLNYFGVFIIKQHTMNVAAITTILIVMVPLFLFRLIRNKMIVRYIVATLFTVQIGILYSFMTYHIVLMFIFPVIIIIPYGINKLMNYTVIIAYINMVVSHLASLKFNVLPEDPFQTLYTVVIYNLIPRLIEFSLLLFFLRYIVKRNHTMLHKLYKYSNDIYLTQREIVMQFAEISESKSGQTGSHVKRVSKYMEVMAKRLGMDEQETDNLSIASMMHDIGKLMISSKIIEKPGKLTDDEYCEIKKHTDFGRKLLENSPGHIMEIAKVIAYQHHERWDGKGYHGIKGNDIDYYSRIMSIIDVFDALISKRSYKEKWTTKQAYDEILKNSGTQFDPNLVEIFKQCYPDFVRISKLLPD